MRLFSMFFANKRRAAWRSDQIAWHQERAEKALRQAQEWKLRGHPEFAADLMNDAAWHKSRIMALNGKVA